MNLLRSLSMTPRIFALAILGATSLAASEHDVRRVDARDVIRLVESHQGKLVILSFWASWCPPCLEEFPDLVAIEKEFRNRGVVVVSVSADFPDRLESDLFPLLDKYRPEFPVYLRIADDPSCFARTIDPEWDGTIPATFFIGRDGRTLIKRYSRSSRYATMTRHDMKRYLESLLED